MKGFLTAFVLLGALFLTACGGGSDSAAPAPTPQPTPPAPDPAPAPDPGPDQATLTAGEQVFISPNPEGNVFSCGTCHSLTEPAADGMIRVGHAIGNATRRTSYKNGQLNNMLDAVNTCLNEWMNAPSWTESSEDWQNLHAFLDSQPEVEEPGCLTNSGPSGRFVRWKRRGR